MSTNTRYNTRLTARKLALALKLDSSRYLVSETPPTAAGEAGRIPVDMDLNNLVQKATATEQAREHAGEDDAEGQELIYTSVDPTHSIGDVHSMFSDTPPPGKSHCLALVQPSDVTLKGGHTGR